MIEIDVHLDAVLALVVVHHGTKILEADHLDLTVARLHEHRALLRGGRAGDRDEGLLVVDIEGAEGEALLSGAGVECAGGLNTRHCSLPIRSTDGVPLSQHTTSSAPQSCPAPPADIAPGLVHGSEDGSEALDLLVRYNGSRGRSWKFQAYPHLQSCNREGESESRSRASARPSSYIARTPAVWCPLSSIRSVLA